MANKQYSPEQAVAKLRQIDVLLGEEKSIQQACKEAGITAVTYYRWRKEYGGLKGDQARRLKELERENHRLKRIVADLSVEKAILKDTPREASKPRAAKEGGVTGHRAPRRLAAPCLPHPQPASGRTTLHLPDWIGHAVSY